ncbi:MAG: flavin reductase family protein, partial [Oscillospiraceae bacterium]|nr:flavin reductase family protein [Oscillospiraceae bacterium]
TDIIPMGGTHDMFLADIVAVNVDEKALDDNNKLRMDKCSLLAYAHGDYFALGKKVGTFGFSVKKKHKSPSRRTNKRLK